MSNLFNTAITNLVAPQKRSGTSPSGWASFLPFKLTEGAKNVNQHSSLSISAFYCAVNTIANSMALLPMSVFVKNNGIRKIFEDHPANYLLYREPNQNMTAFNFKFIMALAVFMRGNAYALISRDNSGNISAYHYLDPDAVSVIENNGKLFYKVSSPSGGRGYGGIFSASEIIHIPGFSFDGITGKSIIHHAADNLGVSLAAQKFGSDSLTNRGVSQGVLESDLAVKAEKKKEISAAFSNAMSAGQKHRAPLLDEGMKYKPITLKPQEAQFIETYANGVEDIARWFQIPLHKLHSKGEGGYNFLVQMSIEYLQTAVMPLAEKFKQEFERKSFTTSERKKGIYINLNYKKLLQADPKARAQFYKDLYYIGVFSSNEIRELEDMNPREDETGDDFVQMSNVLNEMQLKKQLENEQNTNP